MEDLLQIENSEIMWEKRELTKLFRNWAAQIQAENSKPPQKTAQYTILTEAIEIVPVT